MNGISIAERVEINRIDDKHLRKLIALNEQRAPLFFPDDRIPWAIHHGDTIPHMAILPAACIDCAITSVPFPTLYSYSSMAEDIGNSEDLQGSAKIHLSFFYRQMARVLKPGRVLIVHVMQIPRMKRAGGVGLFDFRGLNIRLGERAGLVFEYDWCIRKNPQSQAIRTKTRELQFSGLESDRAKSRGALPDYLLKFRAPGDNAIAIESRGEVSRNDWIEWAECTWGDIRETDTLNVKEGRGENDTKHICPLQLGVIQRCVKLFSNPGEILFDPFNGIGSTGYVAVKLGRRYYGTETKPEYYRAALKNLERAEKANNESSRMLWDLAEQEQDESNGGSGGSNAGGGDEQSVAEACEAL